MGESLSSDIETAELLRELQETRRIHDSHVDEVSLLSPSPESKGEEEGE